MHICTVFNEIVPEVSHLGVLFTFMFFNHFLVEKLVWVTSHKILWNTYVTTVTFFFLTDGEEEGLMTPAILEII